MFNNYVSVFLSHSSKDKKIVREVYKALSSSHIDVWIDEMEIIPGEMIIERIENGLEIAHILILFISRNSNTSSWVDYEWKSYIDQRLRNGQKVYLIPVILDDCEISNSIKKFKYIKLETKKKTVNEITESINKIILLDADEKRGYKSIESNQKDRIIDSKISIHSQELVVQVLKKEFTSFDFHFWQETSGKVDINRTIVYDYKTGEAIPHTTTIDEKTSSYLKFHIDFKKSSKGSILKFLFEVRSENYFFHLHKTGMAFTEFSTRHPIKYFSYRFLIPNNKEYGGVSVNVEHRKKLELKKESIGGEIQYFFETRNLTTKEDLKIDIVDINKVKR